VKFYPVLLIILSITFFYIPTKAQVTADIEAPEKHFGFNPIFRASSQASFKLLFNAILLPEIQTEF
jgi:hypothetical protein